MKVSINEFGMITLKSESAWEDFALTIWEEKSRITVEDEKRMLSHYVHPGYLRIEMEVESYE